MKKEKEKKKEVGRIILLLIRSAFFEFAEP